VGGGVYVTSSGGIAAYNSTIAFNSATYAGGVNMNPYTAAATNPIVSTIIANNVVTGGLPTTADLSSPSSTPIVIGGSNDIIMTIYGVTVPGDTNPADPLLLPLAFNGGSTQTHALDPASPAVDSGLNPLTLTTDQRGDGYPREVPTGSPDIGAYELDTDHIFGNGFD
jgi:hypothetical protein